MPGSMPIKFVIHAKVVLIVISAKAEIQVLNGIARFARDLKN
jgi:hypothetical protein